MGYTSAQAKAFINQIAPLIVAEGKKRGYKVFSTVIAQAIIESASNTSVLGYKYCNYFGMKCGSSWKGKSVNLKTKEEYKVGTLTSIRDNFRVFDSMVAGVAGYYDFISTSRYKNLKTANTAKEYAERLKADGYATSSSYVNTLVSTVSKYNLTKYDTQVVVAPAPVVVDTAQYYPKYTGKSTSIVTALNSLKITSSLTYRGKIAKANGITNYKGTADQNTKLLTLLKSGKLKRV